MKIMIVSNTSLTIRNFRFGLMQLLRDAGHEVVFCAQDNGYAQELRAKGFPYFPITVDRKGTNLITDARLVWNLFKLYRNQSPDIILHFTIKPNIYGSIASYFAGIPCMNTVTGLGYVFMRKGPTYYLVKALYKLSGILAKRTFFQNKDDRDSFLRLGLLTENRAISVNGSGINTAFFDPDFCRSVKKEEGSFIFLFTGRILRDKGVGELVEAARLTKQKYPTAKFWLVGLIDPGNPTGIGEDGIRGWEKEGTIAYFGETKDVRPFICKSDCVVLPSYREGIPRSLLEALSMEKPIITTNAVGCRDVLEEGVNGFSAPIKDAKALFESFCKMIELPPQIRAQMGKAGREKVKKYFEESDVANTYLNEIQKVVS